MSSKGQLHLCGRCFSDRASSAVGTDAGAVHADLLAPWQTSSRRATLASRGRARPCGATSVTSTAR